MVPIEEFTTQLSSKRGLQEEIEEADNSTETNTTNSTNNSTNTTYEENMDPNKVPDVQIKYIMETYP